MNRNGKETLNNALIFIDTVIEWCFEDDAEISDIQALAEECGFLEREIKKSPCGHYCACHSVGDPPFKCFKKTY